MTHPTTISETIDRATRKLESLDRIEHNQLIGSVRSPYHVGFRVSNRCPLSHRSHDTRSLLTGPIKGVIANTTEGAIQWGEYTYRIHRERAEPVTA